MRFPFRALSALLLAVGVATCSDTPPAAVKHSSLAPGSALAGRVAFEPVFSAAALSVAQHLGDFGIHYDRVRVVLTRLVGEVAKDTTVAFAPGAPDITLTLTVEVRSPDEAFQIAIEFLSDTDVVFHGQGRVHAHPQDQPPPTDDPVPVDYVGPGSNVARIALSPKTITLPADRTVSFVAAAFDASGNAVPSVPLAWTTSDASIATITKAGLLQATGRRGSVVVSAITPTGVTDQATAAIIPLPASVSLVSGGGQTGKVSGTLATPAVVQVNAQDGIGVPDVAVTFSPPTGGSVSVASVTTDANGRASTSLVLGTTAGPQQFTATVGKLSAAIPETANPGAPASISVVAGNDQVRTIRTSLSPLVVRVTDRFGNPVPGALVAWTRTAGGGSLGAATSTTSADGQASAAYTLGTLVGTETVAASVEGAATDAVFTFKAIAGAPAFISIVSGNGQTARVSTQLSAPLVVRVTDDAGNPAGDATVKWTAINGTVGPSSFTDSAGRSSARLTLGTHAGASSATATIASGRHVSFDATASPGTLASIVFSTQPANGTAGATLSAVRVALVDANGNQTDVSSPVSIALGNNVGASLGGTLVRNASSGVATFNDLVIDKAGTGYILVASTGGGAPVPSSSFNVVGPLGATAIAIVAGDDQRAAAGSPVPIAPTVKVTDGSGNAVAGVSVTFSPGTGSGDVIPSSPIVTDASGIAGPTSWTLGQHAGPQTLVVSSPGLTSAVVRAGAFGGPPAMLAMATQPSSTATSGVALDRQPVIQLQDHFGNPVAAGSLMVTVTASSGALLGTTSVAADPVTGLAAFTDLAITGSGAVTLTFSAQGVQSVTSSSITVSGGGEAPSSSPTTGARF